MKHPIQRRLMYLGFQGLRGLARVLGFSASRRLGRLLGVVAAGLLQGQRRLTERHLAFALGDALTPAQRRRIAQGVFVNLGQNFMEWLLLPALSTEHLQRLITCEGLEHLRAALAKGNGALLLSPHFGNWELIPLYLRSLGFEGGVLARRLRYPEYESDLINLRGSRGVPTFARGSIKEVAKVLRANQIIGMLPDQDVDNLDGIFVRFFGHPTHTLVGPAALSLMTGAPILPCFIVREGSRFRLIIEPAVALPQTADRAQALEQVTQSWSDVMESYIRRYPDHWAWMHRRWKTQPELPEGRRQTAEGSGRSEPHEHAAVQDATIPPAQPVLLWLLLTAYCLLPSVLTGCGRPAKPSGVSEEEPADTAAKATPDPNAMQRMTGFTLTGYEESGAKRWELNGEGASVEGDIVTVHRPDAVGYEPGRTAYLTASAAQVRQTDRHIRLEHDVTIHTSDGLWLMTPVLHWVPDQDQVATESPVRIETDHMLLRGRGASGLTQLKQATIFTDIELVLNPSDHDRTPSGPPGSPSLQAGTSKQVTITCDGPLSFDYEHHVATFEKNVHVRDPNGDLYSDKLIAYLDETTHTIRYAEATGRVRIRQQQNDAQSERAIYDPSIGKITLVGKPTLLIYPSERDAGTQLPFNLETMTSPRRSPEIAPSAGSAAGPGAGQTEAAPAAGLTGRSAAVNPPGAPVRRDSAATP